MFEVVVLDAMGVLYVERDDVGQILLTFLTERKLHADRGPVEPLYLECSRGRFSSEELWRRLGVTTGPDGWDEEYTCRYRLNDGVHEFLDRMVASGRQVAGLTNDISEWSILLRRRFGLERQINPWIVSGDVGYRKPSPGCV